MKEIETIVKYYENRQYKEGKLDKKSQLHLDQCYRILKLSINLILDEDMTQTSAFPAIQSEDDYVFE